MTISNLIDGFYGIIREFLIPIAFGLCILYFFWGVAKYIKNDAQSEKEEGRKTMIYGVIGIFVAFSIWGIISFIRSELSIPDIKNVERPAIEDSTQNIRYHNE